MECQKIDSLVSVPELQTENPPPWAVTLLERVEEVRVSSLYTALRTSGHSDSKIVINASEKGDLPLLKFCVETLGVNLKLKQVRSLFGEAILKSHETARKYLLEKVEAPFHLAIRDQDIHLIKFLSEVGADINFQYNKVTPLFYACTNGYLRCADVLLERGADPYIRCEWNKVNVTILEHLASINTKEFHSRLDWLLTKKLNLDDALKAAFDSNNDYAYKAIQKARRESKAPVNSIEKSDKFQVNPTTAIEHFDEL